MIKLYYAPFSCAMAIHATLEMVWADYEAIKVKPWSDEYKKIAPKWAVPAIIDDENHLWIMTQIPALLKYIVTKYNRQDLLWEEYNTLDWEYKLNNLLGFINSDLHKSFWVWFAPQRYTISTNEESINEIRQWWIKIIEKQLSYLEEMLEWKKFLLWDKITVADIYAFVVSNWANMVLPTKLENYKNISSFHAEILKNESIQKVIWLHSN